MTEPSGYLAFWAPGPFELVVILIIAVLLFGRRLPSIARSIGKSMTEFKKGLREAKDVKDDLENDVREIKDDIVNEAKDAAGPDDMDKNQ